MDEATKRYSNGSIKNETSNTNQYSMLSMKSQSNDVSENESFAIVLDLELLCSLQ